MGLEMAVDLGRMGDMVQGEGVAYDERIVRDGWGLGGHGRPKAGAESVERREGTGEAVSWEPKKQGRANRGQAGLRPWDLARRHSLTW